MIEGCIRYTNGKCAECENKGKDYTLKDGTCQFINCGNGERAVDYCGVCQIGYEEDDGICVGYDGSRDTSFSSQNKVEFAMLIFILALLI